MTADQLLEQLAGSKVRLFLDGPRLRFRAPPDALTSELRAAISSHRCEIVERLALDGRPPDAKALPCMKCDHRDWVDDLPNDGRIRTTCGRCGRFVGYRPCVRNPDHFA
jgi:hypothetical protein